MMSVDQWGVWEFASAVELGKARWLFESGLGGKVWWDRIRVHEWDYFSQDLIFFEYSL